MDWLKEWVMTICGGAVFCAVINLLAPDERYEKIIKICTSAYILLLIAVPLINLKGCSLEIKAAEEKISKPSAFEEKVASQAENYMAYAAEKVIIQCLEENGINNVKISVSMDTSDNGCISIGHVTVEADNSQQIDAAAIRLLLESKFGIENIEVT